MFDINLFAMGERTAALIASFLFLFLGVITKRLLLKDSTKWGEWFLGVELSFTAMSTAGLLLLDYLKGGRSADQMRGAFFFFLATVFILLLSGSVHRRWNAYDDEKRTRLQTFLLVLWNLPGMWLVSTAYIAKIPRA